MISIDSEITINRPDWPNHGLRCKVIKHEPELYPWHPWLVREIDPPNDGQFHSHSLKDGELLSA